MTADAVYQGEPKWDYAPRCCYSASPYGDATTEACAFTQFFEIPNMAIGSESHLEKEGTS